VFRCGYCGRSRDVRCKRVEEKEKKAVNPLQTMSEKDEAAVELVMLGIGLVVVLILGAIAYHEGL